MNNQYPVKFRLGVVADSYISGISAASRRYRVERKTIRGWRERYPVDRLPCLDESLDETVDRKLLDVILDNKRLRDEVAGMACFSADLATELGLNRDVQGPEDAR